MIYIESASKSSAEDIKSTYINVETSGSINGSITFYASRIPDVTKSVAVPFTGSNTPYRVLMPHKGIWYVWAHDNDGYSPTPVAVLTHTPDVDEVGIFVQNVLIANKSILDKAIQSWYPGVTVQQIVYGNSGELVGFPSILIYRPRIEERYIAFPYTKELRFHYTIAFMLLKQDEQSELQTAVRFARVGMQIFNQPAYETIVLPDGLTLNFCQSTEGVDDVINLGNLGFISTGTIDWSGIAVITDGGD